MNSIKEIILLIVVLVLAVAALVWMAWYIHHGQPSCPPGYIRHIASARPIVIWCIPGKS